MVSVSQALCTRTKSTQAPTIGAFCRKRKIALSITICVRHYLTSSEYRATGGGLSAITHFLQQAINHNEKELSRFDVRAVQITPTSQQESNTSFSSFNSNYIVSRLTASIVEIFGSEFKCGAKFFNNHLERCGDDVDLLLPSKLATQ